MAKDKQSESSKLEQKNAAADKAQEEGRKRYEKQEIEDNQAARKATGEAIGKAVDFVKKGLGMKNDESPAKPVPREEQRKYSDALKSSRDREMKQRGISGKQFADEANKDIGPKDGFDGYKKGGSVKSASSRADGIAIRGKTRA